MVILLKYFLNVAVSTVVAVPYGFFHSKKFLPRDNLTLQDSINCWSKHTKVSLAGLVSCEHCAWTTCGEEL
jgi:hypothetical protein